MAFDLVFRVPYFILMFLSFTHPVKPLAILVAFTGKNGFRGRAFTKKEIRSVFDQLVLAAEQGNVGAQLHLGIECMVGVNVQKTL